MLYSSKSISSPYSNIPSILSKFSWSRSRLSRSSFVKSLESVVNGWSRMKLFMNDSISSSSWTIFAHNVWTFSPLEIRPRTIKTNQMYNTCIKSNQNVSIINKFYLDCLIMFIILSKMTSLSLLLPFPNTSTSFLGCKLSFTFSWLLLLIMFDSRM